ncbi:PKD-like domain-containing protein [Mucilaginibacter celer]|uniref:Gliding motility-associated C-terminal domain-containing protein n=1 Tax=Mucilaginibacter celer TaxID=2305508 RepID=A0A494W4W9_9SPHI|nr:PKD-like domain-containing protein [Mucilaginibacter celer]AYL98535.1 gliding motility-associated C-terminal domain-containing protein [Mucilaginibacter celer]
MNKPLLVLFFLLICSFTGFCQNCTLNVNISSSANTICSGSKVTLTAALTGGTGPFTYLWNTGENTASIDVNRAGNYTVTVTDKTPGCSPKTASKQVTASPTPDPPTVAGQIVCPGTPATLRATAPGGTYQWYDANGNFLFTGNPYVTDPINGATIFYVETTVGGCTSFRSPVLVNVTGRPNIVADPVCSGSPATLIASGADSYAWYANAQGTGTALSNSPTYQTPPLTKTTTYYLVAVIKGCPGNPIPVVAKVTPPPDKPTVTGTYTVCAGSSVNLHADGVGVVEWYDVPTGGTPVISSPDYTTPALNQTKTYYAQSTVGDCVSPRTAVPVTVTPVPQAPASQSPSTCYGTNITLAADANPTGSYAWYTTAVGGTAVSTSNNFTTPVLTNTTTYYVQHTNGSCTSERTAITVTITPAPAQPVVSEGPIICNGSQATLTATSAQGGTIRWFATASGGATAFTGSPFVTPALTKTTTYYAQVTDAGGCVSSRASVTVTVLDAIPQPVVNTSPVCAGTSVTLTATGSPDDYEWYDQPTGGNLLITGDTYVTPELTTTTTYYVQSITNGCASPRTTVTITVNPLPGAPNVNGPSAVCPGTSAVLSTPATGTVQWYNAATGGTLLFTGNSYTTSPLFSQTTFYVQVSNGTCTSDRTPFTVSITPIINPQFQYPSGTVCTSGANVKPVIFNPAGGTFTSSPAGLVFVDNKTGEIDVAASVPRTYNVIFTFGGTCAGAASQKIAIVTTPDARFTYNGPFCQSDNNPLPVFTAGASAGVFSASSSNLVFINTSTGEINLDKSAPGTYSVTNTIAASAGCAASTYTTQVTINAKVVVDAGPDRTVLQGTPVQLQGSIKGGITTGKWTGGAGTFSNPARPRAIYTPAPGETEVTLTLTSDIPSGPCGPVSDEVTITFNPVPPEPVVDAKPVCVGSPATLVAKAPGGTYRWYDAPTGGTLLKTGPIFTAPPITADITYYVTVTKGGITSARKAVLVKAIAQPAAPVVTTPVTVCEGSPATLVASGSTGTYRWYDLPVGGSLVKQGDTFTTGALTTNKKYYVDATANGCTSPRTEVDVLVTPVPNITNTNNTDVVCSGTALNYTLTADRADATFSWSRAAVTGISNPAVTNQTSGTITETLINTTAAPVNVTYVITAYNGTCPGPSFNYKVTVNPTPVVTSPDPQPVCNGTSTNYAVTFNTAGTSFTWSRAAVPGISNAPVLGQAAATIKEVLFNTTTAPVDVTYVFNYRTSLCPGEPREVKVTVNPEPQIIDDPTNGTPVCSNVPLAYTIQSSIPSSTFLWSRAAAGDNPAVDNQTDATINETLVNTSVFPLRVTYIITPFAYGCAGKPFTYTRFVLSQIAKPVGNGTTPVCEGTPIHFDTAPVSGASYLWTGPNNYQSTDRSPTIPGATAANAGTYRLFIKIGDCFSEPSEGVRIEVKPTPVVIAGPEVTYCKTIPVIQLDGSIPTGGTGVWSGGSGQFTKVDDPKTTYTPSPADREKDFITLKLTSTGYCDPVSSFVKINFAPSPGANAGPDQNNICNQNPMVQLQGTPLSGSTVTWSSASGKGRFIPSANVTNPTFEPDPADIAKGFVKLTLTATSADECHTPTDDMTINFVPPPTVEADAAGDTRYVLKGHTITLNPVVSNENVSYTWTPATGLSDANIKNPEVTGDVDITYKLTITDLSNGCPNSSFVNVKVAPNIVVKNTFTPNADGVNDYWEITGLIAYEDVTVDVYNRYGQPVFHSLGYPKPWDGGVNGKLVPSGTYYYVINSKQEKLRLSGYVVVLK